MLASISQSVTGVPVAVAVAMVVPVAVAMAVVVPMAVAVAMVVPVAVAMAVAVPAECSHFGAALARLFSWQLLFQTASDPLSLFFLDWK